MVKICLSALAGLLVFRRGVSFAPTTTSTFRSLALFSDAIDDARTLQKDALLGLLGRRSNQREGILDPVLADPFTKEAIRISAKGSMLGGNSRSSVQYQITSTNNQYEGSSDTYINLLEPKNDSNAPIEPVNIVTAALKTLTPLIPPPLRGALAMAGADVGEYVPMRDLFTSPAVSFAYERGWRQGFAQAGFPGPDVEFAMAKEYFAPAVAETSIIVDMSCATGTIQNARRFMTQKRCFWLVKITSLTTLPTRFCKGLFTRRFAKENVYDRVLGCDYSDSMLTEARRRIDAESLLNKLTKTRLDLIRLDVGSIPMQDGTVDALHAGAAMHCWPDLQAAVSEIYRVLKPGGRYFATTFLSLYFQTLMSADGGITTPSMQAFQYFESVDQLRKIMEGGGFEHDKVKIEVLGTSCVVIRCEK